MLGVGRKGPNFRSGADKNSGFILKIKLKGPKRVNTQEIQDKTKKSKITEDPNLGIRKHRKSLPRNQTGRAQKQKIPNIGI